MVAAGVVPSGCDSSRRATSTGVGLNGSEPSSSDAAGVGELDVDEPDVDEPDAEERGSGMVGHGERAGDGSSVEVPPEVGADDGVGRAAVPGVVGLVGAAASGVVPVVAVAPAVVPPAVGGGGVNGATSAGTNGREELANASSGEADGVGWTESYPDSKVWPEGETGPTPDPGRETVASAGAGFVAVGRGGSPTRPSPRDARVLPAPKARVPPATSTSGAAPGWLLPPVGMPPWKATPATTADRPASDAVPAATSFPRLGVRRGVGARCAPRPVMARDEAASSSPPARATVDVLPDLVVDVRVVVDVRIKGLGTGFGTGFAVGLGPGVDARRTAVLIDSGPVTVSHSPGGSTEGCGGMRRCRVRRGRASAAPAVLDANLMGSVVTDRFGPRVASEPSPCWWTAPPRVCRPAE